MSCRISNYAAIGDRETAGLVSRAGSIDFLCWPRFDSEACFAALIGGETNGSWRLRPRDFETVTRRYRDRTAILQTRFESDEGAATLTDFMPIRRDKDEKSAIIRTISGERGRLAIQMALALRFDYGRLSPWTSKGERGSIEFVCGPHAARLTSDVEVKCGHGECHTEFNISAGEQKSLLFNIGHRIVTLRRRLTSATS